MQRHPDTIQWAAGLFEGEGFLVSRHVGKRDYLQLGIEMRDLDIIQRFVATLAAHGVTAKCAIAKRERNKNNPKHSDVYRWAPTGAPATEAYKLMRPYLGERRRARGDEISAAVISTRAATLQPRPCRECGEMVTVKDYGHRKAFCSTRCFHRWNIKQPGQREAARIRQRRYKARLRSVAGAIPGTSPHAIR